MSTWEEYRPCTSHFQVYRILLQFGILCGLAAVILKWLRRNENHPETCTLPLPGLKVEWWNLYGVLKYLPSGATMKNLGLSPSTYALQLHLGHGALFPKADIIKTRVGIFNMIFAGTAEAIKEVLNNKSCLDKAMGYKFLLPWLGTGLLTSGGSKWKSRRKLLTHSFHFDILKEFVPIFDNQSKILVDIIKGKAHADWLDIRRLIKLCALDIICETVLGVPIGAQTNSTSEYVQAVERLSNTIMKRVRNPVLFFDTIFWLTPLGRQFKKDLYCVHRFSRKIIQEKKQATKLEQVDSLNSHLGSSSSSQYNKRRKALIDVLLDVHMVNEEFTEEDIREEVDTFAFAGHDTTATAMCWVLYLIGLYPDVQEKIHEELDAIYGDVRDTSVTVEDLKEMPYIDCVLKESQRLYPSVPAVARTVLEDFDLVGYKIKKGTIVGVSLYTSHRNPDVFPDPEKFDPDRFLPENCAKRDPFAYIPFSAGARNCIGQRLAMMEEKTVIANILRSFHVKSLQHRDEIFPESELVMRSLRPLKLKFVPRK